jgi:hypothetical protein
MNSSTDHKKRNDVLKRLEGSLTVEHVMLLLYIWLTIEL